MKRVAFAFFLLASMSVAISAEGTASLPRNGVSLRINDLVKIDLSCLFGNIGYSTIVGRDLRFDAGLSGNYSTEEELLSKGNSLTTRKGIGGEIALVHIDEGSVITPFIGLGVSAGYVRTDESESSVAGTQGYANDLFSLSAFVPLGIELRITQRYRLGLMERILCSRTVNAKAMTSVDGTSSSESTTVYTVDIGSPLVYFSLWF
jgi:hypothetical protein